MITKDEIQPTLDRLKDVLRSVADAATVIRELNNDEGALWSAVEISDGLELVQQAQREIGGLPTLIEGWPDTD